MNREIKFRGQRIDTKEWVYGYYFISPLTDENSGVPVGCGWCFLSDDIIRHCISTQNGLTYVVIPETVGQFTNLKDKDNQEMYEGDLIKDTTYHQIPIIAEVKFINTGFWLEGDNGNSAFMPNQQYREVIGNVHDNPVKEGI